MIQFYTSKKSYKVLDQSLAMRDIYFNLNNKYSRAELFGIRLAVDEMFCIGRPH